jgi:hypothetical protein
VTRTSAQSLADVVPRNHEVTAVIGDATNDDVNVRIVGVPMLGTDPIEFRAEIPLGLVQQVSCKGFQVGQLAGIFGRYDEPKMMPIAVAAFGKCPVIGAVVFTIEHAAGSIVLGDALPAQVFQMGSKRRPLPAMSGNPGLDSDTTSPVGHVACGRKARGAATTKRASACLMTRSTFEATGAFRGGQCLINERLATTRATSVANPPKPDAQIIVARTPRSLR